MKPQTPTRDPAPQVVSISDLSPHNRALYEAGKTLLVDSIATAREFCKSMIGISAGAVPIYLGILSYLLPKHYTLGTNGGIALSAPAIGFLTSAAIFVVGYLPVPGTFSLDIVDDIERARSQIINYRNKFAWAGLGLFVVSGLGAIYTIVLNIGIR
jgi:hypothetical protein